MLFSISFSALFIPKSNRQMPYTKTIIMALITKPSQPPIGRKLLTVKPIASIRIIEGKMPLINVFL